MWKCSWSLVSWIQRRCNLQCNGGEDSIEQKGKLFRGRNFSWWTHVVNFPLEFLWHEWVLSSHQKVHALLCNDDIQEMPPYKGGRCPLDWSPNPELYFISLNLEVNFRIKRYLWCFQFKSQESQYYYYIQY